MKPLLLLSLVFLASCVNRAPSITTPKAAPIIAKPVTAAPAKDTVIICQVFVQRPLYREHSEDMIVIVGGQEIPIYAPHGYETRQKYMVRVETGVKNSSITAAYMKNKGEGECKVGT